MRLSFDIWFNSKKVGRTHYHTASDFWEHVVEGTGAKCGCSEPDKVDMPECTLQGPSGKATMAYCTKCKSHVPKRQGDYGDVHEYGCDLSPCTCGAE